MKSVYLTTKFALPWLIADGGGAIVNAASTAAFIGPTKFAAYAAAKGDAVFADDEASSRMLGRILVGRAGETTDIANAVLFLASDDAGFITGQTLVVDGGRLIT